MALIKTDAAKAQEIQNKAVETQRKAAYEQEADPLFFKWQRGEITQQVWLDKVEEIKTRYPKSE
jgi:hypothetical protein